jgi:hypothetical protein
MHSSHATSGFPVASILIWYLITSDYFGNNLIYIMYIDIYYTYSEFYKKMAFLMQFCIIPIYWKLQFVQEN